MVPIENIQEFRSDGAWYVSFCALLIPAYKVAGPRNHWPDQGPSNGAVIFLMQDFRKSSEALGLSQVSEMLQLGKKFQLTTLLLRY